MTEHQTASLTPSLGYITAARIEMQRGMLFFFIAFDYKDGGSQAFTGYVLDEYSEEDKRRVGTACGCDAIVCLMRAFKVTKFSDIAGRYAYALRDGDGLAAMIRGVRATKRDGGGEWTIGEWHKRWNIGGAK